MGFSKDSKDESKKRRPDATPKFNREVRRSSRLSDLQTQFCPPSQADMTTMHTQFSIVPPPPRATESSRQDTTTRRRSHRLSAISFANDSSDSFLLYQTDRQPLGNVDKNSPTKSSPPIHAKTSNFNNQEHYADSQANVDVAEMGDIDLDFDDDDLLTSTLPR
jgi:hypothetical protein